MFDVTNDFELWIKVLEVAMSLIQCKPYIEDYDSHDLWEAAKGGKSVKEKKWNQDSKCFFCNNIISKERSESVIFDERIISRMRFTFWEVI